MDALSMRTLVLACGVVCASACAALRVGPYCLLEMPGHRLVRLDVRVQGEHVGPNGMKELVGTLSGWRDDGTGGDQWTDVEGSPVLEPNGQLLGVVVGSYGDQPFGLIAIAPRATLDDTWQRGSSFDHYGEPCTVASEELVSGTTVALLGVVGAYPTVADFGVIVERRGQRCLCIVRNTAISHRPVGPTHLALARAAVAGIGTRHGAASRVFSVGDIIGTCVYDGVSGAYCVLGGKPETAWLEMQVGLSPNVVERRSEQVVLDTADETRSRVGDRLSRVLSAADLFGPGKATVCISINGREQQNVVSEARGEQWLYRQIVADVSPVLAEIDIGVDSVVGIRVDVIDRSPNSNSTQ